MSDILFLDLKTQQSRFRTQLSARWERILDHGQYILGPEVTELETKLKDMADCHGVVGCGNGTDALLLALMCREVGPGDAILVPTFTFAATAEVVALSGATPIFVDICPETFNLPATAIEAGITQAKQSGLKAVGVIAVDLFGLPADYPQLNAVAESYGLWVVADAAQSFGGSIAGKPVGSLASLSATSFFPSKPLGGYGDGGAVFVTNEADYERIRCLRVHGQVPGRYEYTHIGMNSRLDSVQAAVLLEKLAIFEDEWRARQRVASFYEQALLGVVKTPVVPQHMLSAWALYTIQVPSDIRDALIAYLKDHGVPTRTYYTEPLHTQAAYQHFPIASNMSQSLLAGSRSLCLPMHPYLSDAMLEYIVDKVRAGVQLLTKPPVSRQNQASPNERIGIV